MIDSTDRARFSMQPQLGGMKPQMMQQIDRLRPQFDIAAERFGQPTQVAPPMEPPATLPDQSVLMGIFGEPRDQPPQEEPAMMPQQQSPEQNIRRMMQKLRSR